MKELVARNWAAALTEVIASLVGTLGMVVAISAILSLQSDGGPLFASFWQYFEGGQIGLPILSLSGIVFIALTRHGPLPPFISLLLYVLLILPIIATAFIIGLNPGFRADVLTGANLKILWFIFLGLHLLWFFVQVFQPTIPSAQEAGERQDERVNRIKTGAANRGE